MAGLQGIQFGNYGYAAHLGDLATNLRWARQQVRDLTARQASGRPVTDETIAQWQEKVTAAKAAYDRAKAEAI